MKQNKIYGVILAISMLIFAGCGNDTKENPPPPDGPYSFFDASTPLKITKPVEINGTVEEISEEISVVLLKYGLGEVAQIVQMVPFPAQYGSVVSSIVETDENGRATFEYKAPEGSDYDNIRGHDVTIEAIFEEPLEDKEGFVDPDAPPVILLTQEFLLQFR